MSISVIPNISKQVYQQTVELDPEFEDKGAEMQRCDWKWKHWSLRNFKFQKKRFICTDLESSS